MPNFEKSFSPKSSPSEEPERIVRYQGGAREKSQGALEKAEGRWGTAGVVASGREALKAKEESINKEDQAKISALREKLDAAYEEKKNSEGQSLEARNIQRLMEGKAALSKEADKIQSIMDKAGRDLPAEKDSESSGDKSQGLVARSWEKLKGLFRSGSETSPSLEARNIQRLMEGKATRSKESDKIDGVMGGPMKRETGKKSAAESLSDEEKTAIKDKVFARVEAGKTGLARINENSSQANSGTAAAAEELIQFDKAILELKNGKPKEEKQKAKSPFEEAPFSIVGYGVVQKENPPVKEKSPEEARREKFAQDSPKYIQALRSASNMKELEVVLKNFSIDGKLPLFRGGSLFDAFPRNAKSAGETEMAKMLDSLKDVQEGKNVDPQSIDFYARERVLTFAYDKKEQEKRPAEAV